MLRFLVLLLTTAAAGAFVLFPGWEAVKKPNTMVMWLDPSFSREEGAIIASAAGAWNSALGSQALQLFWGMGSLDRDHGDGVNTVTKSRRTGADTTQFAALSDSGIYLADTDVRLSGALWGNSLYNVALHEFGHVLGLLHSTEPGSIMGYTLQMAADGYTPLPVEKAELAWDDIAGAFAARFVSLESTPTSPERLGASLSGASGTGPGAGR